MNDEQNLRLRALRHAALAEPVRLRIVDLLALGDRSPTELRAVLDLPSNLLAHHLSALERAGLIRRGRSEGDRRRSYVSLAPAAEVEWDAGPALAARRIVFVCTANSARSQLAVALWTRASSVPAASAGTHPADRIEAGAIEAARRHGMSLRGRRPRDLAAVRTPGDVVVTVCDRAHEELSAQSALHWSVPDPVRGASDRAFDDAVDELARRVESLAPRVSAA